MCESNSQCEQLKAIKQALREVERTAFLGLLGDMYVQYGNPIVNRALDELASEWERELSLTDDEF